jgi:hypothetical protein
MHHYLMIRQPQMCFPQSILYIYNAEYHRDYSKKRACATLYVAKLCIHKQYELLENIKAIQAVTSRVRVPMGWIFFNLLNPSSHTMSLGSTQPLTEMSTWNLPGG